MCMGMRRSWSEIPNPSKSGSLLAGLPRLFQWGQIQKKRYASLSPIRTSISEPISNWAHMDFAFFLAVNLRQRLSCLHTGGSLQSWIRESHRVLVTQASISKRPGTATRTPIIHASTSYMCPHNPDTWPHAWNLHTSPTIVIHAGVTAMYAGAKIVPYQSQLFWENTSTKQTDLLCQMIPPKSWWPEGGVITEIQLEEGGHHWDIAKGGGSSQWYSWRRKGHRRDTAKGGEVSGWSNGLIGAQCPCQWTRHGAPGFYVFDLSLFPLGFVGDYVCGYLILVWHPFRNLLEVKFWNTLSCFK